MVTKFEETGSLNVRSGRGKKPVSAEAIEKVALQVEEDKSSNVLASTSVRRVAEVLDLPCSTVQKIMQNILRYYPYKLQFVQELLPHDFETRHLFSLQFLARLEVDPERPWNILWTDEAHFYLDGAGGPATCYITGQRYASLLRNKIIPDLQASQCLSRIIFMQDGAPPHIASCVTDVLKHHFTEELAISPQFRHLWPPRSPDLNPCEFWLWGHLKQLDEVEISISAERRGRADRKTNQEIRRHLDAFNRGRIIGKLEEGRSVTSAAAEFGIAHSIVSRLWRQFQTTGTAIRGFSSGRPRGTTPADDRYIVLQARRNRRQTAGEIARHATQATGRTISRFTVTRRLHGGGLYARRPVRCVPLTPAHGRRRSLRCREHRNWRDNGWGRVLFTDESLFSLRSDSHRILIAYSSGESGEAAIIPRTLLKGTGSVNGTRYCNEILLPYVRLFRGAMGLQFLFMEDNAPCHHTVAVEQLLESSRLAALTLPPVTIRELRLALQDEWAAMPQQLIDTLILSMGRRCETWLAVRRDHIPY
ncbi:transposable element Tcb2 transposase [Trichonephila clavipes]|nr:transposable element Tcb2 transposase [Trichonephila clavipes]